MIEIVGLADEAQAAGQIHHQVADSLLDSNGFYQGWRWWRGADRIVWLPPNSRVVYKIDCGDGINDENEHDNMVTWRSKGREWAPPTYIYDMASDFVLAMPYPPHLLGPTDELPASIHEERVDDLNRANFRLDEDGMVMLVDAGYPSQGGSHLASMLRHTARHQP